ncbi:MAG: hypothetical protein KC609_23545 [Myxococcales bacterium]|nr:hypothetical protein [Myxococcales bacterium]
MRPIDRLVLLCLLVTAVACGGSGSSNGDQQQDGSANTDASDSASSDQLLGDRLDGGVTADLTDDANGAEDLGLDDGTSAKDGADDLSSNDTTDPSDVPNETDGLDDLESGSDLSDATSDDGTSDTSIADLADSGGSDQVLEQDTLPADTFCPPQMNRCVNDNHERCKSDGSAWELVATCSTQCIDTGFDAGCRPDALFDSVSAGKSFSCAINDDGTLWCFGRNSAGNLGVGDKKDRGTPQLVGRFDDQWRRVSAGDEHTCAIKKGGGKLFCWGNGSSGRLGDGTSTERLRPTEVATVGTGLWLEVYASNDFSCGIQTDQTLWCWGNRPGSPVAFTVPTKIGGEGPGTWLVAAVSPSHVCGVQTDNKLYCFGSNSQNAVGIPSETTVADPKLVDSGSWTTAAVGHNVSCALSGKKLFCWGTNALIGIDSDSPAFFGDTTWNWLRLQMRDDHMCGVRQYPNSAVNLFCWGEGQHGRLGLGSTLRVTPPVDPTVPGVDVSVGFDHSCSLSSTGQLSCFGNNSHGQLGIGFGKSPVPKKVIKPKSKQFSVGSDHSCAVTAAGVLCWGNNRENQLNATATPSWGSVPQITSLEGWVSVSVEPSGRGSCGVKSADNGNYCWGLLGLDDVLRTSPTGFMAGTYRAVFPRDRFWCGWRSDSDDTLDNAVSCFGTGTLGQMGVGVLTTNAGLVNLNGGDGKPIKWNQVSYSNRSGCGIGPAFELLCWGDSNVAFGDTKPNRSKPEKVLDGVWLSVGTSDTHSCAISELDKLWCWGHNQKGQLGVAPDTTLHAPKPIGSDSWSQVSVGTEYTCAVRSDGKLFCFGDNAFGQSGSSDYSTVGLTEVTVSPADAESWLHVATSRSVTCAERSDGWLYCFGDDSLGALGRAGTLGHKVLPTLVDFTQ